MDVTGFEAAREWLLRGFCFGLRSVLYVFFYLNSKLYHSYRVLLAVSYPHLSFGFIVELFLVKFQCCVVMMFLGVQSTGFSGLSGKKLWSFSLIVLGS